MDWSNVTQIGKCRYSYSRLSQIEVFRSDFALLVHDFASREISIRFNGNSIIHINDCQKVLRAFALRQTRNPMILYQTGDLKLFDNSEECVSDLLQ